MNTHHHTRFYHWLIQHYIATYIFMVCLFLIFGVLSLDLVKYVSANTNYLLSYGFEALWDDGFVQFIKLLLTTFAAVLAYLGFKICEHALINRASHQHL